MTALPDVDKDCSRVRVKTTDTDARTLAVDVEHPNELSGTDAHLDALNAVLEHVAKDSIHAKLTVNSSAVSKASISAGYQCNQIYCIMVPNYNQRHAH